MSNLWKRYKVTLRFTGRLCGSVPLAKELVRPWLEARAPKEKPATGPSFDELETEVEETLPADAEEERLTLGFQKDEKGLFVRAGSFKAHLKDCANQIKNAVGVAALKNKVANKVYLEEERVYLTRDGKILQETDGDFEQPVHVITSLGPRSALKVIRFVITPVVTFHLLKLKEEKSEVTEEVIRAIFEYGGVHGFGGERGMGEGRYTFTLEEI